MDSLVADYGSESEQSDSSDSSDSETSSIAEKKNSKTLTVESQPKKPALPPPSFDDNSGSIFINPYIEAENAKSAILEKHVKMIPSKEFITEINGRKLCWMYKKGRCRFGSNCKYAHDSELYNQDKPKSEENPSDPNNIPTSNTPSPPPHQGKPPGVSHFPPHQPTKDFQTSQGGFPPSKGGFPPSQGGFQPSKGGFPPSQGGFPTSQGGFPKAQGGFPPSKGGFPPSQGGFPPSQGGFPPSQGGFPSEDNDESKPFLKKKRPGLSQNIVPGKKVMKMYYSSGKQGP